MNTTWIQAVLVDLDDTIYPQAQFLSGAWAAVAAAGDRFGIPAELLRTRLTQIAGQGSDQGRIIDRALLSLDRDGVQVTGKALPELVATFHSFRPRRLHPYPGVAEALLVLRQRVPVALISDGNVDGQLAKINALGLADAFDAVVLSDSMGRQFRKPRPAPFLRALDLLGVSASAAVMVGDRPDKDIAGAATAGIRAVRVRTGEYSRRRDTTPPWRTADDLPAAVQLLLADCPRPHRSGRQ